MSPRLFLYFIRLRYECRSTSARTFRFLVSNFEVFLARSVEKKVALHFTYECLGGGGKTITKLHTVSHCYGTTLSRQKLATIITKPFAGARASRVKSRYLVSPLGGKHIIYKLAESSCREARSASGTTHTRAAPQGDEAIHTRGARAKAARTARNCVIRIWISKSQRDGFISVGQLMSHWVIASQESARCFAIRRRASLGVLSRVSCRSAGRQRIGISDI